MPYPPLRYYLERVLRDMGGVSRTGPLSVGAILFLVRTGPLGCWPDWRLSVMRPRAYGALACPCVSKCDSISLVGKLQESDGNS